MVPSKIDLSPKTRQQIAEEYGIHRNTLYKKLKEKGIKLPTGLLMPPDIKKIYDTLGYPEQILKQEK